MAILKRIYDLSPAFVQDLFLTVQAYKYRRFRYGGRFQEYFNLLKKTEKFSSEEMNQWRISKFKEVFDEAYQNTQYYKDVFDRIGVKPSDITDFEILQKLPLLTKDYLRSHPTYFINRSKKIVYTAKTGGTTGAPLITPFDAESTQLAFAFMARFFEQVGIKYNDRNLHMTGQQVVPLEAKHRFWRTDYLGNSLYLSIHHLGPKTFELYWKKILKFKPKYIFGYASFIYDLSRYVNEYNKNGELKLLGVFPSSEKLTDIMRDEMEKAFSCKVYDHYGSTEGIPLITQCKEGNYHIVPESGIIEFLDEDGKPVDIGSPAEMYMTSLRQFARPILRYKIGDTAILSDKTCSCGLHWPVIEELTGRLSEWITLKDGRKISQFSHQVFKLVSNVEESQIIQHDFDKLEVLIVRGSSYGNNDEEFIRRRIIELAGDQIQISFTYIQSIPKTSGGKKPSLISKVK